MSVRLDISQVTTHTTVSVTIRFTGAPDHAAQYSRQDRRFLPQYLEAEYEYDAGQSWWRVRSVTIVGPYILKPAADGSQRLGKGWGKYDWYGTSGRDMQERGELPEWLDQVLSEIRPAGALELPGI